VKREDLPGRRTHLSTPPSLLPQQDPQGLVGHKFALEAACGRELDAIASTNKQDACYPLWAWHYATFPFPKN